MTYLVERLAELRRHVNHLRDLRAKATERAALERDLSLHNDVMFSLLMVSQLVNDIAGELSARRGDRFDDYTEAIRTLGRDARFPADLVRQLEPLVSRIQERRHPRVRRVGSRPRRRGTREARAHRAIHCDRGSIGTLALSQRSPHSTSSNHAVIGEVRRLMGASRTC